MKRRMPRQRPGTSEQNVATPWPVIRAAERKLHISSFCWDLAADATNQKVSGHDLCTVQRRYFTEADDALTQDWLATSDDWEYAGTPWNWLNPPFARLNRWMEKCVTEAARGAHTAILVPSSSGSRWYRDWVHGYGYVLHLSGRVTFEGHTKPYPKDLDLILYTPWGANGSDVWPWREEP